MGGSKYIALEIFHLSLYVTLDLSRMRRTELRTCSSRNCMSQIRVHLSPWSRGLGADSRAILDPLHRKRAVYNEYVYAIEQPVCNTYTAE